MEMKYLRRFNEELNPDTYIRAGRMLSNMPGGVKRSSSLIDYGSEKKYGFYKMHWGYKNHIRLKDVAFTNLRCESYFSQPDSSNVKTFYYSAEDAVERWKEGESPLCITFNFFFQATEETKEKFTGHADDRYELISNIPMFSFEVHFSNWDEGLDAYNWDEDNERPMTEGAVDLNGLYDWSKDIIIYIKAPQKKYYGKAYNYFGIFSDRASALKFKRKLNDLLDPHKEKVTELLSCVNGSGDDISEYEDRINKISINNLFSIEAEGDCQLKWFKYNNI
jgi:hypothetical protein